MEPKKTWREKLNQKVQDKSEALEKNNPKLHKYGVQFKDLWDETFPKGDIEAQKKLKARREKAKIQKELEAKMKEMTEEELEAYMESIPEWKRGALVHVADKEN